MIAAIMTDREMALALGEYTVRLLGRISALECVFMQYKITNPDGSRVEIPWNEDAKRIAQEADALEYPLRNFAACGKQLATKLTNLS